MTGTPAREDLAQDDGKPPRFSLEFRKRERGPLHAAAWLGACLAVLALGSALASRAIYDHVLSSHSLSSLAVISGAMAIILAVEILFRVLRHRWTDATSEAYDIRVSGGLFSRLLGTRMSSMARSSVATSLFREFEAVRDMRAGVASGAWVDAGSVVLFLVALWLLAGWLVIVPALGLLSVLVAWWAQKRIEILTLKCQPTMIARQSLLQESVYGIEDVKLARAEGRFQAEMEALTDQAALEGARIRHLSSNVSTIVSAIGTAVQTAVTVVGAVMAIEGHITTGTMIAASILSGRVMAPCNALASLAMRIGRARSAERTVASMADSPQENTEGMSPDTVRGDVEFQGVNFHYAGREQPVLRNVSLRVPAGATVALIGPKGGGKSTLGRLLTALAVPDPARDSGSVLLDEVPVTQYAPDALRRLVGGAPQDAMLFSRSILDNIRLAKPDATDEEVVRAANLACAHDWIVKVPGGYGAMVQEGGRGMSGGERQSLALARVILSDPKVVFMDEPTAHFDPISTNKFVENMREWLRGRTAIIATHKPDIMMLAQRAIVISDGRVLAIKEPSEMLGMFKMRGSVADAALRASDSSDSSGVAA